MKILFVYSGNHPSGINPIIKNQAESLVKAGISIYYFPVQGKGVLGYLKHLFILRNYLKNNRFDLVHAHYLLSALVATFASRFPLVVSFMGSDLKLNYVLNLFSKILSKYKWNATILKSKIMSEDVKIQNSYIIPNGVNLKIFKPLDKTFAKDKVNFKRSKKYLLFAANPERIEKNYQLARQSYEKLNDKDIVLKVVFNETTQNIVNYLNAADILILTSLWEGSPNIIKEAMACNCPIVTTNVGDIDWVLGNTPGCYISGFEPEDVKKKILLALQFSKNYQKTNGRERLIKLGLDSETIAQKIIGIYMKVLSDVKSC